MVAFLNKKIPKLYHISFKEGLEGMWEPRLPDSDYSLNKKPKYPESSDKRICCSPTLEQCFQGIYSNINHLVSKYKILDFNVYSPELNYNTIIVLPETLTKERIVHDAHITNEYNINSAVFMKFQYKINIEYIESERNRLYYYPFNDKSLSKDLWLPINMKIKR